MSKDKIWSWIEEHKQEFIDIADKVWNYAELGLVEEKSSKLIAENLKEHGFKVTHGVAGMPTAIYAQWGKGKPVLGFQGEYDALPGISNKVKPEKDAVVQGAPGHGCGHNIHGATALACVVALRYLMEEEGIPGTLNYYGTPAEENYGGKVFMVREGLYNDLDACLSHHPGSMNTARLSSSTAVNGVKFVYRGKTAHAAGNPEMGRSSLDAIELMNIGVNYLREHVISDARIHYVIEEGGGQPNVVPDYARSWYYIRAPERDQLDPIYKRIIKIAEGAALMTETELEVQFIDAIYNIMPNKSLAELVVKNMREVGAPEWTEDELKFAADIAGQFPKQAKIDSMRKYKVPNWQKYVDVDLMTDILDPWGEGEVSPGSSDVGDVSWVCPTLEFGTACNALGAPGHSWAFVACSGSSIGHKSLVFASKTMAGAALELLTDEELRKKIKAEHKERLAGKTYETPLPEGLQVPLEIARENWEKSPKQ
ncbi:MAG: amidohydrolase [Candidatus Bathyarchaeota archaeon]|nr:amidohydrolase [Candidatus Bathyarchaeota archaeon]